MMMETHTIAAVCSYKRVMLHPCNEDEIKQDLVWTVRRWFRWSAILSTRKIVFINLFIYLCICLFICFFYLFICLFIYLFVCLFLYVYLFIYLFICLFVCLFVCLLNPSPRIISETDSFLHSSIYVFTKFY